MKVVVRRDRFLFKNGAQIEADEFEMSWLLVARVGKAPKKPWIQHLNCNHEKKSDLHMYNWWSSPWTKWKKLCLKVTEQWPFHPTVYCFEIYSSPQSRHVVLITKVVWFILSFIIVVVVVIVFFLHLCSTFLLITDVNFEMILGMTTRMLKNTLESR